MSYFFKRNLVWITILLCITGITLSIVGIPTNNPIFFFIGVILSIPTIGYLIYQVFIDRGQTELNLAPTTTKTNHSNITSIISNKEDILLSDNISEEENLESLYHGCANEEEITQRLQELTNNERNRTINDFPEIIIPEAKPIDEDEQENFFDDELDTTANIENLTNNELLQHREEAINQAKNFAPEIPTTLSEHTEEVKHEELIDQMLLTATEEVEPNEYLKNQIQKELDLTTPADITDSADITDNLTTTVVDINDKTNNSESNFDDSKPSLIDPNFVLGEPVMPKPSVTPTKSMIIRINPQNVAARKQKAEEKKALLSQPSLERHLHKYLIETAACFLMDRSLYKDDHGIAPYNKYALNKDTGMLEYSISRTKGRLYKLCNYLIDAERFINHQVLYEDFVSAIDRGVPIASVSEVLHPLYRKKYKKDFILNLSHREDWDNVMILVYNNYILNGDNFKDVFIRVPFEIPVTYNEQNIIDYLKDPDIQDAFTEKFSALEEIGFPTFWEALYICFIGSIKQKLTIEQIEDALLRDYKKVTRALKRLDSKRRKLP